MKLINNIVITKTGNEYLMINSLNGLIDNIDYTTFKIIDKWYGSEEVTPVSEKEKNIFDKLESRGYLCNSFVEELQKKEKIILSLRERHSKIKLNKSHLTFVMTYDCNFQCPYCFEKSGNGKSKDVSISPKLDLSGTVIEKGLIDAALELAGDSLKTIGLFGGEPLLPKNMSALEYIFNSAPDKIYNITTNGYFLDQFLHLLVKIKISHIMITLDGDEKTHDSRRFLGNGKPTFVKIISNIGKCLDSNIFVKIRMNLDESNINECLILRTKLLKQFRKHQKLISFELSPMMEMSSFNRNKMFIDLFKSDIEYNSEEKKQMNQILSRFSPIVNLLTTGTKLRPLYSFCTAHDSGLIVDPYGYLYPCLLSVGKIELAIGRYYPFEEYYENSIRNRSIETILECKECKYSLLCGGGCPVSLKNYDDINKPECYSIKNQIHNLLPMYYNISSECE